ncbi:MAG TPA: SCO1664 family protein [Actinomycetota bacterium]|nr:SCO1664 family protein [Actinomycetota bacterium]
MRAPLGDVMGLLERGDIELLGLLPRASNYTFAVKVAHQGVETLAVYKPRDGETPLWDFAEGTLYRREIAAYEVSRALGWDLVPPTIARDGPYGVGSLQLFVDAEPGEHYLSLLPAHADAFRRVAAFDVIVNNADRKSGHCMLEREDGAIRVVDHGVCFHEEVKLRTVIWDFAGEPLPLDVVAALRGFDPASLDSLLSPSEIDAMAVRARDLIERGIFPDPPEDRRAYPWPPI